MPEFCLVQKPVGVSHADAAVTLRGGVKAYTTLAHQTKLEPGAIIMICSATSGDGLILMQLCDALGVKVSHFSSCVFHHADFIFILCNKGDSYC